MFNHGIVYFDLLFLIIFVSFLDVVKGQCYYIVLYRLILTNLVLKSSLPSAAECKWPWNIAMPQHHIEGPFFWAADIAKSAMLLQE